MNKNKREMILFIKTNKFCTNVNISLLDGYHELNDILAVSVKKEMTTEYYRISIKLIPFNEITLQKLLILDHIDSNINIQSVLLNGYQSWTETREYKPSERLAGQNFFLKPILNNHFKLKYGSDYMFYKYKNKKGILHSFSWSYIREDADLVNFTGSLAENTGFTIIEYDCNNKSVQYIKDCSGRTIADSYLAFDLLFTKGTEDKCFEQYFSCLGLTKKPQKTIYGWTSWYKYFNSINQSIIYDNLDSFASNNIKLDYFQIDDGYQKHIGDWLQVNEKFPDGMNVIAERIHQKGYKAGLWIAPFICEKSSDLYKKHYDWILKQNNKPVPAGRNSHWDGDFFVLDFYNVEFQEYLENVFRLILDEWEFDLVKIDFLYAACIVPRKDKTRGEIMHETIAFLRKITGKKKLLGCGVPICAAFGNVDFCRIGPDVGFEWENKKAKFIRHRERISTINSIKNTIYRRHLNGYGFLNDPDVFILRKDNINLSFNEKFTLFMINFLFGNIMFCSDVFNEYDEREREVYLWQFSNKNKIIDKVDYTDNVLYVTFHSLSKNYFFVSNFRKETISVKFDNQYQTLFNFVKCTYNQLFPNSSLLMYAR